jgi:hypothetical protein
LEKTLKAQRYGKPNGLLEVNFFLDFIGVYKEALYLRSLA